MKNTYFKLLSYFLWLTFAGLGSLLVISGSLYLYLSPKLPSIESLRSVKLQTPLRIYSQDLKLIGEFGEKRRTPITFSDIPPLYVKALLSAEDDRFYEHGGVDIAGLLRAASQLITAGEIKTGGSTITMQVARNFFLTRKQTFTRKFNEILLALRIEDDLSKDEILTLYANKIYQGNRAYGIDAAALVYYGKPLKELSLAQLAMIAGLPKAPSAYNPIANPDRALIRRNWILKRMLDLGYIEANVYQQAKAESVSADYHGYNVELDAPYIAEIARKYLIDRVGEAAYTDGYRVYTTINSRLQHSAQTAVQQGLIDYDQRHGYRGPEAQIIEPAQWPATLEQTSRYGNLVPAIITGVNDQSLDILLKDDQRQQISWKNGLKGLRKYNSPNSRSAPIKTANELFSAGDLIRVEAITPTSDTVASKTADFEKGSSEKGSSEKGSSEKDSSEQSSSKQSNPEKDAPTTQWRLTQLPKAQAAIVALNPENGGIQALVGGFDFYQSNFNRITQAERQPGSNFKPFIYTTALENGFTAASILNDAPVVFEDKLLENSWRPENDSGKFYGPTRLRKALYLSRNLISIRVLRSLGIKKAIKGLERFGFDASVLPRDLSLSLGSHAVTPLEIATGYAALANGGYQIEPFLIDKIEDAEGNLIYQATPLTVCRTCDTGATPSHPNDSENTQIGNSTNNLALPDDLATQTPEQAIQQIQSEQHPQTMPQAPRIIEPQVAYIIDSILKDVIQKGTGKRARVLERSDIAGKTGTTNGPKDAWFSGYSPHIVATAWLGFDENLLLGRREYGGSAALPIWIDFMKHALEGQPVITRPQPKGIVMVRINPKTGLRVGPDHANAIFEIFRKENVPPMSETRPTRDTNDGSTTGAPLPEDLF